MARPLSSLSDEELEREIARERASTQQGIPPMRGAPDIPADPIAQANAVSTMNDRNRDNTRQDSRVSEQNETERVRRRTIGLSDGYRWASDGNSIEKIPGYVEPKSDRQQGREDKAAFIRAQTAKIRELYEKDIKGQPAKRAFGATEYLSGLPSNERFTTAGQTLLGLIRPMIAMGAKEGDSDREMLAFEAFLPKASDTDETIEFKLNSLDALVSGVVGGASPSEIKRQLDGGVDPKALMQNFDGGNNIGGGGNARRPAPIGSDTQSEPVNPEYQRAYSAFLRGWDGDPDKLVGFRTALDEEFGYEVSPQQQDEYRAWATDAAEVLRQGGSVKDIIPDPQKPLAGVDAARNAIVNNPVGAFVADAANMGSFGAGEIISPEAMAALREGHPVPSAFGQVAGAIGGTGMIGRLGREAATRVAPRLLQGQGKAQFGRNLATDAAYAGAYGGVTEGDPLTSAALGIAGSAAGQGAGKVLGRAIGGVKASAPVQAMRDRGIPLSVARTLGPVTSRVEDAATSLPIVGDMIRRRSADSFDAFNRAAFREAGEPIGYNPTATKEAGVDQLRGAAGQAYDAATAGVNAPLDARAMSDIAMARAMGDRLTPEGKAAFEKVLNNYIDPIRDSGAITGQQFQNTTRALKGKRNKPPAAAQGFEQEYKDAITANQDALRGAVERAGGDEVVTGLSKADEAYRNMKTLEDAVYRARNGSRSGELQTFAPSQLIDAGAATKKKFPGQRPFKELADAGQEVLPSKVPDSGTAGRAIQAAVGAGLLGTTGGYGYASDDYSALGTAAGVTGFLAALGTRKGQAALNTALMQRPGYLDSLGSLVSQRAGLLGSGSLPFFIE